VNFGYIVNADEIEKTLTQEGNYSLNEQNISTDTVNLQHYFRNEGFSIQKIKDPGFIDHLIVKDNNIHLPINYIKKLRVLHHGHPVPEKDIRNRYTKSLNLLYDVIKLSDRAYLFDNSGKESLYVAEITDGENVELHCNPEKVPNWFINYVKKQSHGYRLNLGFWQFVDNSPIANK